MLTVWLLIVVSAHNPKSVGTFNTKILCETEGERLYKDEPNIWESYCVPIQGYLVRREHKQGEK